jgi:hypothetical protein
MRRLLLCLPFFILLGPVRSLPSLPESVVISDPGTFVDDSLPLPESGELVRIAREDPTAFLEHCLRRYQRTVQGYTATLIKQECLGGQLQPRETIELTYFGMPHSVLLRWVEGQRLARAALYVEGENRGPGHNGTVKSLMLVQPAGTIGRLVKVVTRDPDGPEARQSGRYSLPQVGLANATLRTWASWKAAQTKGQLTVEYLGEAVCAEAGNRLCYKLRRTKYHKPEEDGVAELTIYIDKETWLQVGSELKGLDGQLIAAYYFANIELNPSFSPNVFGRETFVK